MSEETCYAETEQEQAQFSIRIYVKVYLRAWSSRFPKAMEAQS